MNNPGHTPHDRIRGVMVAFKSHVPQASLIVVLITGVSYLILELNWQARGPGLRLLASLVIAIIIEVLLEAYYDENSYSQLLKGELESCSRDSSEARIRAEEAQTQAATQERLIEGLQGYFDTHELPDLEKHAGSPYLAALRKSQLDTASVLIKILGGETAQANYRVQVDLADVLTHSATNYFWATSKDRPSDFHKRNYHYLKALDRMVTHIKDLREKPSIPAVGRIFVGHLQDFYKDLMAESTRLLELYDWHIHWWRAQDGDYPIRFFCYENEDDYNALFAQYGITGEEAIADFIVMDGSVVYGRRSMYLEESVQLGLLGSPGVAAKYERLYPVLWAQSFSLREIVERIRHEIRDAHQLRNFLEQCDGRESRLAIEKDYGGDFSHLTWRGADFFQKIRSMMARSGGNCFALDRADKKGGDLIETWAEHPYAEFKEATKQAAVGGACVRRLFIVQERLNRSVDEVKAFVKEFLTCGITVGFIFASELGIDPLNPHFHFEVDS